MDYKFIMKSFIGDIVICSSDLYLTYIGMHEEAYMKTYQSYKSPIIEATIRQLEEYFGNKRQKFDLPIYFNGTPFQVAVWKSLIAIPYGETRSYQDIAKAIENPKACRAVGNANNKNKIMIVIPCHRVIASGGKLGGFGGGLDIKINLLACEKNYAIIL